MSNSVDDTLKHLHDLAALPLSDASAMRPEMYTSEGIYALERARIFHKSWLCAGRAEAIPQPGDYLTYHIDRQPLVVIRQKDASIKAFANVCRHRMMPLLSGQGNCQRIVCPYHAWTYAYDGRLLGAPYMQESRGFDKANFGLLPIRCEVWRGWLYVTLDATAPSIAEQLQELDEVVEVYAMQDYQQVVVEDHIWNANWKHLTENFMEGYHLPVAHKATVGSYFPVEDTRFSDQPPNAAFTYQTFTKNVDSPLGTAHADNSRLSGILRRTSVLPTIFPSHMITLAPDHLWYLSLQPAALDRVHIRYGIAFAPEVLAATRDRAQLVAESKAILDKVNREDRFVVEGLCRGSQAPLASPGRLSWLERENHEFTQYLSRRLQA